MQVTGEATNFEAESPPEKTSNSEKESNSFQDHEILEFLSTWK